MVQETDEVRLHDEEEELLDGNAEERGAKYRIGRVGPDAIANQVRVPWYRRNDGYLQDK